MKTRGFALFAGVLIASLLLPTALAQGDEFATRGQEWATFYNDGDIAGLAQSLYTTDARFEDANGATIAGREAIDQLFSAYYQGGLTKFETSSLVSGSSADRAYDYGTYDFYTADGTNVASGNYLTLLRLEEGEWKIFFHFARATPEPAPTAEAN